MRKNLIRIALFTCLIVLIATNIFYYVQSRIFNSGGPGSAQNRAANAVKTAEKNAGASLSEMIHGQIIYEARAALPPQAILDIKLTESDPARQQAAIIIAETRQQLLGRSPLDWTLPVLLKNLEAGKSYNLQAKISSGDTLLFVNAPPMPVDHNRAAYIMRLAKIDDGTADMASSKTLIGQNWLAESFAGKAIESHSEIGLYIDEEAKTDPTDTKKRYHVSGSGGCNRFMGSAIIDEDKRALQFSPLAATFIACAPDIARQEANFIDMMGKIRGYRLDEAGVLYLLDEEQNALARFILR